jgi:hypothetical protein
MRQVLPVVVVIIPQDEARLLRDYFDASAAFDVLVFEGLIGLSLRPIGIGLGVVVHLLQ